MENFLRLPAEWESQSAVLIAWPHSGTDWCYMLPEVTQCFRQIAAAILDDEDLIVAAPGDLIAIADSIESPKKFRLHAYTVPTNDTWARDFGPISMLAPTGAPVLLNFVFNAWGMKFAADLDNLITPTLDMLGAFDCPVENHLDFVLEGGSIECDGKGCILTTEECLLSPNRNAHLSKAEIECYLKRVFNASKVVWLQNGALAGDDTDSHIDTLARFAPADTILYVGCDDPADEHFAGLKAMEKELQEASNAAGVPFRLIKLPFPDPVFDNDGLRLPATYANFLITNHSVLVPTYNQPENDARALELIASAFPGRKVVGIDCRALIKQHGSLHCVTMQLPTGVVS